MLRFIIKELRYDGECLNALKTAWHTVAADVPELEKILRSGGQGGGPDGDAFQRFELTAVEVPPEKK